MAIVDPKNRTSTWAEVVSTNVKLACVACQEAVSWLTICSSSCRELLTAASSSRNDVTPCGDVVKTSVLLSSG